MSVEIRPYRDEDAPAIVALLKLVVPLDWPIAASQLRHRYTTFDPGEALWLVAYEDGELVGWGETEREWGVATDDTRQLWVTVRPTVLGRGLGRQLADRVEAYSVERGGRTLLCWTLDDNERARRFAEARGFVQQRTERMWVLDPATVDLADLPRREQEAAAAGIRVATVRELPDRTADLHRLHTAIVQDVPADVPLTGVDLERWKAETLGDPLILPEACFVALDGSKPVALAWLEVNLEDGVAGNSLTGTLPEYRRRGLARLLKLMTIRWAVEHGIRMIGTGNDSNNQDMLALNDHLGYDLRPSLLTYMKAVGDREAVPAGSS